VPPAGTLGLFVTRHSAELSRPPHALGREVRQHGMRNVRAQTVLKRGRAARYGRASIRLTNNRAALRCACPGGGSKRKNQRRCYSRIFSSKFPTTNFCPAAIETLSSSRSPPSSGGVTEPCVMHSPSPE
jgi:hypothetical protein